MDPLTLITIGSKLIDKFFPDKEAADKAKLSLLEMQQKGELKELEVLSASDAGQVSINVEEAKSDDLFKSGWRPFIGWMCGAGLGYQFLFYPVAIAWIPKIQQLDMGTLVTLLFGMLGLGAYRTMEKMKK